MFSRQGQAITAVPQGTLLVLHGQVKRAGVPIKFFKTKMIVAIVDLQRGRLNATVRWALGGGEPG